MSEEYKIPEEITFSDLAVDGSNFIKIFGTQHERLFMTYRRIMVRELNEWLARMSKVGIDSIVDNNDGTFTINLQDGESTTIEMPVIEPKNSIEIDGGNLQLVGDEESPGPGKSYGTDEDGNKGYVSFDESKWENDTFERLPVQYGYLYNWYAVDDARGIINTSDGWRMPTSADYTDLNSYLDLLGITSSLQGRYLKSCRQVNSPLGGECLTSEHPRWVSSSYSGHNTFGMGIVPSSNRSNTNGSFYASSPGGLGYGAYLWTATNFNTTNAWIAQMFSSSNFSFGISQYGAKKYGHAIRVVRDATIDEQLLRDGAFVDYYTGNDGKKYKAVKIGTQIWTAENLAETKYSDDDDIPFEGANSGYYTNAEWIADTTPKRCAWGASSSADETYVMMADLEDAPYYDQIRPKDEKKIRVPEAIFGTETNNTTFEADGTFKQNGTASIVLKSPNGTLYKLVVDNAGIVSTTT